MKSAVLAAAVSCLIGAAGFGGAIALAGSDHAAWPCSERPYEKHCTTTSTGTTPSSTTVTVTTPPVTVTAPAPPAQTVTLTTTVPGPATTTPGKVVVKGKPTCAHGDWDVTAPRCKPKLIIACKGKYRREILRWCLRYEAASRKAAARHGNKPREVFHTGAGVTG